LAIGGGGQPQPFAQVHRANHASGYRLAVQPASVASDGFQCVGEGVPEVEQGPQVVFFPLVPFDNVGFEAAAPRD
jgi:hypothetical protein